MATRMVAASPARPAPGKGRLPKLVYYALVLMFAAFLAANTFESTFTSVVNVGKWGPLVLLLLAGINAFTGRRNPALPMTMLFWITAFFFVAVIASFTSIIGFSAFANLMSVILVILTGYVVASVVVATDSRRQFFDIIAMLGRILVGVAFLFLLARINLGRAGGFSAWVDNPNTLATMITPGLIVFMAGCLERRPGWQFRHLLFLIIGTPVLILSQGRASFLWVIVSAGAFWVYRRGSWPSALALGIGAIILIGWWEPITDALMHWAQLDIAAQRGTGDGPLSGREEVWRIGAELFSQRPLFGYGMGSSSPLISTQVYRFVRFEGLHFHSSYIMLLVETGAFGLIIFVGMLITTIVRGIVDSKRTRVLPREAWPTAALPFVIFTGALCHAIFESWFIAAGNVSAPLFWILVWMIHLQAQIPIRKVVRRVAAIPYQGTVKARA